MWSNPAVLSSSFHVTNLRRLDLWAVLRMLLVDAANLEALALLPIRLAGIPPLAIAPDHDGGGTSGIAKAARKERLCRRASPPAHALGKQREEIAGLAGSQLR